MTRLARLEMTAREASDHAVACYARLCRADLYDRAADAAYEAAEAAQVAAWSAVEAAKHA